MKASDATIHPCLVGLLQPASHRFFFAAVGGFVEAVPLDAFGVHRVGGTLWVHTLSSVRRA